MAYCLLPKLADEFKQRLRDGRIDPKKLSEMSSKERHSFFNDFLGEHNAKNVNALFESKLLLKNQQAGFISWAKKLSGISKEARRDIILRIEKMDKILTPESERAFLEDLASKRLGVDISIKEANEISAMSKKVTETKAKMKDDYTFNTEAERLEYGRAKVALMDYVGDLKAEAGKLTLAEAKLTPINAAGKAISNVGGLAKSLRASLDNSVIGRQGLKVMFTNPTIWLKNASRSFIDIARSFGGKEVAAEVKADVLSRPNSLNGLYAKEKLAVGVVEEAFPTSLPSKVPILGKAFKASEAAFTSFQYRTRADVFDRYVQIAQRSGADIKGIGKVANSLTGRGDLGFVEPIAGGLNNIFFSPRFLKANFDTLTGHILQYGELSPFARKQAAQNLVKVVIGIGSVLAIADAVSPGSVEKDPRSADFGKIKVGDTRFDVSGGMSSLVTLSARMFSWSSKSSTSGKVTKLNTGDYGSKTVLDVAVDFLMNKASPIGAVLKDVWLKGKDFEGNPPTVGGEIANLTVPLPVMSYLELSSNPNSANVLAAMILEGLGIGTNTYSPKPKKKRK